MTSNIAESLNAVLKEAREYLIIALLEFICSKLMNWFAQCQEVAKDGSDDTLTPRVLEIVSYNFKMSAGYEVQRTCPNEYEV